MPGGQFNLRKAQVMTTFLTQRRPMGIVHRGFGKSAAENSLAAVQQAVDLGFECVEIDARLTADGHLVVWHDPKLPAAAGPGLEIAKLTFEQVSSINLPGRAGVARLAEFLTTWPELTFMLDVKRDECVQPLARLLTEIGAVERVCVHGSDTDGPRGTWVVANDRMRRIRDLLGPQVCTTIGSDSLLELCRSGELAPMETGRFAFGVGAHELTPQYVEAAQAAGVQVIAADPGDQAGLDTLVELGVDAFSTDVPVDLHERMVDKGLWAGSDRRVSQKGTIHA